MLIFSILYFYNSTQINVVSALVNCFDSVVLLWYIFHKNSFYEDTMDICLRITVNLNWSNNKWYWLSLDTYIPKKTYMYINNVTILVMLLKHSWYSHIPFKLVIRSLNDKNNNDIGFILYWLGVVIANDALLSLYRYFI